VPTINRSFTIYEVSNSYVSLGTGPGGVAPTISATFTMSVSDDSSKLQADPASAGSGQILSVGGAQVDSFNFFYDDSITINGASASIKTFQLTINGTTRSFIMSDGTNSIPGAGVGTSFTLNSYASYTELKYKNVACFVRGTLIETKSGFVTVENLHTGDLVKTMDRSFQPIRWIGTTTLSLRDLLARPDLGPIVIPPDSFGPGLPNRRLRVSPQHRFLLSGWEVQLSFGIEQALAPATTLVGKNGIFKDEKCRGVDYVHFMFDQHEIVFSEGMASESFLVGDTIRDGMDQDQLQEILTLFPELENMESRVKVRPARPILRRFEVRTLSELAA